MTRVSLKLSVAFLLIMICELPAYAGGFKSFEFSEDQKHLVITEYDGSKVDAPIIPQQVGFAQAKLSPDGQYIGWLALFPNVSYPVPLNLVVMDSGGHLLNFESDAVIFEWCFLPDSKSVAFMSSSLHFTDGEEFEWRSLENKRLLGTYGYPDDYDIKPELRENDAREKAKQNAPAWVKCVPKSSMDD